jgi:hypothetical protein
MATEYIFVITSNSDKIERLKKFAELEEEKIKLMNKRDGLFTWLRDR